MKKADIISNYNALLPEFFKVVDHYEKATGQKYPDLDLDTFRTLGFHASNWGKEYLEDLYDHLQGLVKQIPQDEEIFLCNKDFKVSEIGKDYISGLESRKDDLYRGVKESCQEFYDSFNNLLKSVGLSDWVIAARIPEGNKFPNLMPSFQTMYFDIRKKDMPQAYLHISINHTMKDWTMHLGSCLHSNVGDITAQDEQYQQFKTYVTICEHSLVFQTWMEVTLKSYADKIYFLTDEIEEVENDLKDPYTSWEVKNI